MTSPASTRTLGGKPGTTCGSSTRAGREGRCRRDGRGLADPLAGAVGGSWRARPESADPQAVPAADDRCRTQGGVAAQISQTHGPRGDRLRRQGHQPRQHRPEPSGGASIASVPGEGRRLHRQRRDRHGRRLLPEEGPAGPPLETRGRVLVAARLQVRLHRAAISAKKAMPSLELAYALTVHKSQGSEFGTVILVLPNPCRLLSRELLYTALTRQKDRIVILHQGPRTELAQVLLGRPLRDRAPPDQPLHRAVTRRRSMAASSRST